MSRVVIHKHYKLVAIIGAVLLSVVLTPALFYKKYDALREKQQQYIAKNPEPSTQRPSLYSLQRTRLSYLLSDAEIEALLKSYREQRKFTVDKAIAQRLGEKDNGTLQWLLEELNESFKMQYANDEEISGKRSSIITFAKYEYPAFRKDVTVLLALLFAPTVLVLIGLYVLEHSLMALNRPKKRAPVRKPAKPSPPKKK